MDQNTNSILNGKSIRIDRKVKFGGETERKGVKVDLVNFKIFALLMCAGEPKEKAGLLFDLIIGRHGESEVERNVEKGMKKEDAER